jgi:hypothetical protein
MTLNARIPRFRSHTSRGSAVSPNTYEASRCQRALLFLRRYSVARIVADIAIASAVSCPAADARR